MSRVGASLLRYARVGAPQRVEDCHPLAVGGVNAAALVDAPRVTPREIRPLTPEEAKQFLKAAANTP